ncbi:MAG: PAS domain S-box protein [Myxococcota bacterium]
MNEAMAVTTSTRSTAGNAGEISATLQALLECMQEGACALDLEARCTLANRACARMLGYTEPTELVGKPLGVMLHAHNAPQPEQVGRSVLEALRDGRVAHVAKERLWRADGTEFHAELRCQPLRTGERVTGVVLTLTDITQRIKTEEEIQFHKVLLAAQTEASIDGMLVSLNGQKWNSFNRRFLEMWRQPREIVESRDEAAALKWVISQVRDPEQFLGKVKYLYEHKDETSFDVVHLKDGRAFDRYSAPVVGPDGV